MDRRLERIAALRNGFEAHPSVETLGARLENLEMLYEGTSYAKVSAIARHEFLVNSDLKSGLPIVQGGISFALADFAGVYAAMVLTEKHALLASVNQIRYLAPITEGDVMIAHATAIRISEIFIHVTFSVADNEGVTKLCGNAYFRDANKK